MRSICAVVLFPLLAVLASDPAEQKNDVVRTPVTYGQDAFVLVCREGVAAVRFSETFEKGNENGNGIVGTSYEWRYLPRTPMAEEQTGTGRVFAKLMNGEVRHGSFKMTCGPVELQWAHVDSHNCTIEFDPTKVAVHPITADLFGEQKLARGEAQKPIELTRFLAAGQQGNKPRRATVAGAVHYENSVLFAQDAQGIATFRFGKVFERKSPEEEGKNEKLIGVSYEFTFTSHDGTVQKSGQSEVYERYRNQQYDRGKLQLEAGPIQFEWSQGGPQNGWMYYDPSSMRVSYVVPEDAPALIRAMSAADSLSQIGENPAVEPQK